MAALVVSCGRHEPEADVRCRDCQVAPELVVDLDALLDHELVQPGVAE